MRYGDERGSYEIETLPGSPQIAVSCHAFVFPGKRGVGLGKQMHEERIKKLKDFGYDYVICTVRADNLREIAILTRHGWAPLSLFKSSATDHFVRIYGKHLREESTT